MRKLSAAVHYECATSFKYIWIFYLASFLVVGVIYLIAGFSTGSFDGVGTNCLEMNSMVFIGVLGVLGFKEDFKMLIQNGYTRKYIYLATFSLFIFDAAIMSLVDTVIGKVLHTAISNDYDTIFGSLYGYGHSVFMGWLWLFFVYMLICSLFYLVILAINKLEKRGSLYLGIGVVAFVLIVIAIFRFVLPGGTVDGLLEFLYKGCGFMADGTVNLIYPILLLILLIGLFGASAYMVVRRTELRG